MKYNSKKKIHTQLHKLAGIPLDMVCTTIIRTSTDQRPFFQWPREPHQQNLPFAHVTYK
jgi:hypothetical protein